MRIVQICDMYLPHISGVTNCIDLFSRRLSELGNEVTVATWGDRGHRPDLPYRVVRSPGIPWGSTGWQVPGPLSAEVRDTLARADVAHAHHPFVSGPVAVRFGRRHGFPVVFTNHTRYDVYGDTYASFVPGPVRRAFIDRSLRRFYASVDAVLSPSPQIAEWLSTSGLAASPIPFPNVIDIDRFARPCSPATKSSYGFAEDSVLFVYLGRVAEEKNMSLLVSAFIAAAADEPRLSLLVVGDGPSRQASERALASAGLSGRARFLGAVEYARVPDAIAPGDVFVTASVSETYPLVVMEAAAAGMAALGVRSPGVGEIVVDGETGLLVGESAKELSSAMLRLVRDRELRERLRDGARAHSATFDIRPRADELVALYERLVEEKRADRVR